MAHARRLTTFPTTSLLRAFLKPEGQQLAPARARAAQALRDLAIPERDGGYLDLERVDAAAARRGANLWIADFVELYEDDVRLTARPQSPRLAFRLPSDQSFASYEQALAHILRGRSSRTTATSYWPQTMLDVWLQYPIGSERSSFSIRPWPGAARPRVVTGLRFLPPGGDGSRLRTHG